MNNDYANYNPTKHGTISEYVRGENDLKTLPTQRFTLTNPPTRKQAISLATSLFTWRLTHSEPISYWPAFGKIKNTLGNHPLCAYYNHDCKQCPLTSDGHDTCDEEDGYHLLAQKDKSLYNHMISLVINMKEYNSDDDDDDENSYED